MSATTSGSTDSTNLCAASRRSTRGAAIARSRSYSVRRSSTSGSQQRPVSAREALVADPGGAGVDHTPAVEALVGTAGRGARTPPLAAGLAPVEGPIAATAERGDTERVPASAQRPGIRCDESIRRSVRRRCTSARRRRRAGHRWPPSRVGRSGVVLRTSFLALQAARAGEAGFASSVFLSVEVIRIGAAGAPTADHSARARISSDS